MLSNKLLYPSFLRTIPSDKNQVAAMIQILVRFNWTWVALLGSDNAYGLEGMQGVLQLAPAHGICIAYQGVIPTYSEDTVQTMRNIVDNLLRAQVNTIVVFSSKSKLSKFMPFVIERKVTGKVWIGTEDWSTSSRILEIPGVESIGTVIGVSVKYVVIPGFEEFERKAFEASAQYSDNSQVSDVTRNSSNVCLHGTNLYSLVKMNFPLETYDITSSYNVYKAVYALAHALHKTLKCDSGVCQRRRVHPWEVSTCTIVFEQIKISLFTVSFSCLGFFIGTTQGRKPVCFGLMLSFYFQLLLSLKQVRFSLGSTPVYFDANGDPPTGYDIICWVWEGTTWSIRVVGSFKPIPVTLTIDPDLIAWHKTGDSRTVCLFN